MKPCLIILFCLQLSFLAHGQEGKSLAFESSKGQWELPISNVLKIDTMGTDCLGISATSFALVLQTNKAAIVKAIQPGVVQAIHYFDDGYTIIVRSGDYFLIYSGVLNPQVRKADYIASGCELGCLKANGSQDYAYSLAIQLFKGSRQINISRWFNFCLTSH